MDKVSKISKSKQVANDFKQQYREEIKSNSNNFFVFDSMLKEEQRKLKEKNKKDKEKSGQIAEVHNIYETELQKAQTSKIKIIKQTDETKDDKEHDER